MGLWIKTPDGTLEKAAGADGYALPLTGGTLTGDLRVNGQIRVNQGDTAAPGYSFTNGTNSGMYNNSKDVYFAADGTEILRLGKAFGLRMNDKQIYNASFISAATGSQEAPAFRFTNAAQNGMYGNSAYVAFTVKAAHKLVIYEDKTLVKKDLKVEGLIDGQLGLVPNDYWAPSNGTVFTSQGMTSGSQGSHGTSMTSNGYRNTTGKWTSMGVDGQVGATEVTLRPNGTFEVRAKAYHPTGSSSNPQLQFLVTDTETKAYGDLKTNGKLQVGSAFTVDGDNTFAGHVRGTDGSAAWPSFTFQTDTKTGIFRHSAACVGVTSDGAEVLRMAAAFGLRMNNKQIYNASSVGATQFKSGNGTKAAPAYSFDSDTKTGIYRYSAGILSISANGVDAANFGASGVSFPNLKTADVAARPNVHINSNGEIFKTAATRFGDEEIGKLVKLADNLSATVKELSARIEELEKGS